MYKFKLKLNLHLLASTLWICVCCSAEALAQAAIPAPPQEGPIAVVGAKAHLGDGTVVEDAVIAFAAGKLTYVGPRAGAPSLAGHTVIEAAGKKVYPGFISMGTQLGLLEIEAVRATDDMIEVGYYNPNARALIAYNTDSEILPTVRNLGILIAQITPLGSGLVGQSSAVYLDGWHADDVAIAVDEGMHLDWPNAYTQTGWWAEPGGLKKNEKYAESLRNLEAYFAEAKAYQEAVRAQASGTAPGYEQSKSGAAARPLEMLIDNPRFRSMGRLFEGSQSLYVHANYPREIEDAIYFAERYKFKLVLVGARDAYLVKDLIAARRIPVVLGETQSLPDRNDDLVDQPFQTPAQLHAAKVPITFSVQGAWQQRRTPYQAGQAVGFGMPYEEAVRALTLTPATVLGIDDRVGSLAVGKDATLFISQGDALDMRSAIVERAFVQGRDIDLASRQTNLADKYREKYRREKYRRGK